jgi:hypothetical protein
MKAMLPFVFGWVMFGAVWAAPDPDVREAPEAVGRYGDLSASEFTGTKAFSKEEIIRGLCGAPLMLMATHPRSTLRDCVSFLEQGIKLGYLDAGFPDTAVTVFVDRDRQILRVNVVEGRRLTAGPVVVEGNRALSAERIAAALTEPRDDPRADAETDGEKLKPLWTPGGPARLGPGVIRDTARGVQAAYFAAGHMLARIETTLRPAGEDTVSLVVSVKDEGKPCRLGAVRFEGKFTDDPEVVKAAAGIRPGMSLTEDVKNRIALRLESLGRYLKAEVAVVPTSEPGVLDLKVRLFQADFAPPLERPDSEVLHVLRRARDWLNDPPAWGGGFVFRFEVAGEAGSAAAGVTGFSQFVLAHEGFGLELGYEQPYGPSREHLRLLLEHGEGLLASAAARIASAFTLESSGQWLFSFTVKANDPEAEEKADDPMSCMFGLMVKSVDEGAVPKPFAIDVSVQDVGLTWLACRDSLRFSFDDRYLYVDELRAEGLPLRIAAIDRATGRILPRLELTKGPLRLTVTFEEGAVGKRLAAARRESKDYGDVSWVAFCVRTLAWYLKEAARVPYVRSRSDPVLLDLLCRWLTREEAGIEAVAAEAFARDTQKKEPEKRNFKIPLPDAAVSRPADAMAAMVTVVASHLISLLPHDSWPQVLVRESACIMTGRPVYTSRELQRVFHSPGVGPVGCWAFAEALRLVGSGPASCNFAARGVRECTPHGFRKELALLTRKGSPTATVLGFLGLSVKKVEEETRGRFSRQMAEHGGDELKEFLPFVERAKAGGDPLEAGAVLLEGVWEAWLCDILKPRLVKLTKPPAPTRDIPL